MRRGDNLDEIAKRFGVSGTPAFFARAEGACLWDADGKRYIDYVGSWGPMILGHAHPDVIAAVVRRAADGLSFGAPSEAELTIARRIIQIPNRDEDMGAMFVRHMLWRLHEKVGDGTVTAAVIFQSIYNQGLRYLVSGGNAMRLRHYLEAGLRVILDGLPPDETRYYVPKLQAIKNIVAQPELFGIQLDRRIDDLRP